MYINGEWIETDEKLGVYNPANGKKVYEVNQGSTEHINQAIDAAQGAFKTWSQTTALERADLLIKIYRKMETMKEELAAVITREMGKPINDARGEVQSSIDYFRWFAEEGRRVYGETIPASAPDKRIMVIKQPIGVVGAITPWNFPLSMLARKLAPALAAGCTIVLKPSSQSPQSAIELVRIAEQAGLPRGVLNLVMAKSQEVTDVFMKSRLVKKITFTGSTRIGKMLMKESASTVKRISMELGGHAPFIVFEDADLDLAVNDLLMTKFRCSGQMCTSTNRIYVQASVMDEFVEKLSEKVKALKVGSGSDEDTVVGPIISESAANDIRDQIDDALSKGARAISAEMHLSEEEAATGCFIAPTILVQTNTDMKIISEETFGPVAPIIEFQEESDLLEGVNHAEYGLASYMYSRDMPRIIRMTENLDYGMVGVNDPMPFVVQSPFGGVKQSGVGKEGGHQGLEAYLEEKMISLKF